ncbi:MAG: 50S ribosomal protein L23 [Deltaproteobacteria bacterium]|nr:50S ribosomal protein L23 [Deltaproteobacteria bacterium]
MKSAHDVIIKPLVLTEKGETLREDNNQYLFKVAYKSTKPEIKSAIEKLFNVGVAEVNTMIVRGKPGRLGRRMGKRPNWKKAIVTLNEGDAIEFFEGV